MILEFSCTTLSHFWCHLMNYTHLHFDMMDLFSILFNLNCLLFLSTPDVFLFVCFRTNLLVRRLTTYAILIISILFRQAEILCEGLFKIMLLVELNWYTSFFHSSH